MNVHTAAGRRARDASGSAAFILWRDWRRAAGLTLLETMLAAAILAIAATAAAIPFAAGLQQTQEALRLEQAGVLAEALMAEIIAHPFDDPNAAGVYTLGPEAGETNRTLFDNIDDYHGYSEASGGAVDLSGSAIGSPGANGLWRSVTVQYTSVSGQATGLGNVFALVTVTVTDGSPSTYVLKRLVTREY
jgi:MSHA pilin protein MshD